MPETIQQTWGLIAGLAAGTFAIRLGGYLLGARIPADGPWGRAMQALPGCLIAALLAVILAQAGPADWVAGALCLGVALITRNLPLTMLAGVGAVWLLRPLL
ncbi:MAG: hypothetical protein Kow0013_19990 [Pararhodobacter sp.]